MNLTTRKGGYDCWEGRCEFDDKKGWRMTAGPAGVEEGCEWAASA